MDTHSHRRLGFESRGHQRGGIGPRALVIFAALLAVPVLPAPAWADLPVRLVDSLGDTFTLHAYPQRIVSLAPSNTELLYALGAASRVVGLTTYCNYPPEAVEKRRIGGFKDPNLELIVSLQPDLVLAARHNPLIVLDSIRRLNIPLFAAAPSTLRETLESVQQVGRLIGCDRAAAELHTRLMDRVAAVEHVIREIPDGARPKVMWGALTAPMYSAGPGSFIGDLIHLAGGRNIAEDTGIAWPQIGLETVVSRDPQVIVVSSGDPARLEAEIARLRETPGWSGVSAVVSGRIHYIDMDLLGRPGPRLVEGLEILARVLYSDRFPK